MKGVLTTEQEEQEEEDERSVPCISSYSVSSVVYELEPRNARKARKDTEKAGLLRWLPVREGLEGDSCRSSTHAAGAARVPGRGAGVPWVR